MNDEQIKAYHAKVADNINQHGYHITYVAAGTEPSFCYSTGIYKSFGIPESFISSLPQNLSGELVGNYARKFKDVTVVPVDQKISDLSDRFPVYLIDVPTANLKEYALSSIRLYGDNYFKCVQLIYPDTMGKFPNDDGYDYDQVILGEFTS
jgi:hypothetical protein